MCSWHAPWFFHYVNFSSSFVIFFSRDFDKKNYFVNIFVSSLEADFEMNTSFNLNIFFFVSLVSISTSVAVSGSEMKNFIKEEAFSESNGGNKILFFVSVPFFERERKKYFFDTFYFAWFLPGRWTKIFWLSKWIWWMSVIEWGTNMMGTET